MRILILSVLIVLLFRRIVGTPASLNKTIYKRKMQKINEKYNPQKMNRQQLDNFNFYAIMIAFFLEVLMVVFYINVGVIIGTKIAIILSVMEVVSKFVWMVLRFNENELDKIFEYKYSELKFHRLYLLFNLILDYIYYLYTIYMLMK